MLKTKLPLPLVLAVLSLSCTSSSDKPDPDPEPKPPAYRRAPEIDDILVLEDRRVSDESLLKHLSNPEPLVRRRAVLALARIQDPKTAGRVAARLADADSNIVQDALWALGQIGNRESADQIIPLLDSNSPDLRALALEALGKLGQPAHASYAWKRVKDPSAAVRAEVATALMRMNDGAKTEAEVASIREGLLALGPLLSDPSALVRWRTACVLSRFQNPPLVAELEQATTDSDPNLRMFAVRALGRSKESSTATLIRCTRDPEGRVAYEAINALEKREGEDVVAALRASSMQGEPLTIARAVEILALKNQVEPSTLAAASKHPSPTVRSAAIVASAKLKGADGLAPARKALFDPHPSLRRAAVRALAFVGGPDIRKEMSKLFEGDDRIVQCAILDALSENEETMKEQRLEVDALIRSALRVNDIAVRGSAVGMLEGRTEPDWLGPLEEAYRASMGREMYELREQILKQLETMKLAGAEGLAREAMSDAEYAVRVQASKTLAAATGTKVEAPVRPPVDLKPVVSELFPRDPVMKIVTNRGTIRVRLMPEAAQQHVQSFMKLAKEGFYNGKSWHRVVPNFVIQGGDPRGDGWGDAGFTLRDEISRARFEEGMVGMAKAGKDTGSCQLFITHVPTPHLDGRYTVFGKVIEGMDVVRSIEVGDRIESVSGE